MRRIVSWPLLLLLGIASLSDPICRADVAIGAKGPAWTNLPGVDGKNHSLSELSDAKVVVIAFTCVHCPVAADYEDRFVQLATDYAKKGVAFVAINCNGDTLAEMKERAADKKFPFQYVSDESQKIGRQYGAITTPHLFVLDRNRNVAYMGAFDNNKKDGKPYVRNAVDALLADKPVEVSKTLQFGCRIPYNN